MLKSVEKCGTVKSIKCCEHVKSGKDSNFPSVDGFHYIIREFEQSCFSGIKFAISRLQGAKLGDMEML